MKSFKLLFIIAAFTFFITSCTNNNSNTGGVDSASVSTNPAMGGSTDTNAVNSSDSTDIRMPMADSASDTASGVTGDSTNH